MNRQYLIEKQDYPVPPPRSPRTLEEIRFQSTLAHVRAQWDHLATLVNLYFPHKPKSIDWGPERDPNEKLQISFLILCLVLSFVGLLGWSL